MCAGKHSADLAAADAKRSSECHHHLQQLARAEAQHRDALLELQRQLEDARQYSSAAPFSLTLTSYCQALVPRLTGPMSLDEEG